MKNIRFSIVLPCYNEASNLPDLLCQFNPFGQRTNFELILVNNGSTDDTAALMENLVNSGRHPFLRTVTVPHNQGYGHGILEGLNACRGEILAYSHADHQTPPSDIFKVFDVIEERKINMETTFFKGRRINRSDNAIFYTGGLTLAVRFLLGKKMEDINAQPKVFHRNLLQKLDHPPSDFSFDVYVMYRAAVLGLETQTIPVDFGERLHGESHASSTIKKKIKTILNYLISIVKISVQNLSERDNPIGQLLRYAVAGAAATGTLYAVFLYLFRIAELHYMLSFWSGYAAAIIVSFVINRIYTFKSTESSVWKQFVWFVIINAVAVGSQSGVLYALVEWVKIRPEFSVILSLAVSITIQFLGLRLVAFRRKSF